MFAHRNRLVLLCALVLAVFYLTVYGDLCAVDDYSNIMEWSNSTALTLRQIFLPGCAAGGYYRPLVGLSYLIDLRLFDLDSQTLHLENVLLHVGNALLVYLLALSLIPRTRRGATLVPLGAALLFGLHPIATESVNWISGRTDLIACFFVLLAALLLVRYRETGASYLIPCAALSIFMGMLGKEVALGFLPGALLLVSLPRAEEEAAADGGAAPDFHDLLLFVALAGGTVLVELAFFNFWVVLATAPLYAALLYLRKRQRQGEGVPVAGALRLVIGCALAVCLAAGIGYAVRRVVFTSSIPRIPETVKLMMLDPNHTFSVFLGSAGFYVKKFLLPLPLSFGIREIDPFYAVLGTLLLFGAIVLAFRRTLPGTLSLAGAFLFVPALPLAFGTVAWTAYAERYIYLSSALWSVALAIWCGPRLAPFGRKALVAGVSLFLVSGVVSVQRNLVWHDNLTLMRDTVEKSPRFREARTIYMEELVKAGDLRGATEQYRIASALPAVRYDERLDAAMARVHLKQGNEAAALELYERIYAKTRGTSATARRQLGPLLEASMAKPQPPEAREQLRLKLQHYRQSSPLTAAPGPVLVGQ